MTASSGAPAGEVVEERRDSIVVLRLNRPEARNALTPTILHTIGARVVECEADPGVRAVVITGTGDRAFSAGADLRAFTRERDEGSRGAMLHEGYQRLLDGDIAIPVVGAANGAAVGGGLELLFGCDLIVASSEARFGLPEVKRGLFAPVGVLQLANRVPLAVALELALGGELVDAGRAYQLGLVNVVVPPDQVLDAALRQAERIVSNGPLALAATKEVVRRAASGAADANERMLRWRDRVFSSEDAREGAAAFLERRQPRWQGR